nr:MAG TPA: hypothetical protein [Caudoviricetes sp.]
MSSSLFSRWGGVAVVGCAPLWRVGVVVFGV